MDVPDSQGKPNVKFTAAVDAGQQHAELSQVSQLDISQKVIPFDTDCQLLNSSKAGEIRAACQDGNVNALVSLACSDGGLLADELRKSACKHPLS
jgi:hypothetical protein